MSATSPRRLRAAQVTARGVAVALLAAMVIFASPPWVAGVPGAASGGYAAARWEWPLQPEPDTVVRPFTAPASPWGPGHRGVDLLGHPGQQVAAIGAGVVTFSASIAGIAVVVVKHGALRSTYQPVHGVVAVGDKVSAGQLIGTLVSIGSHCLPSACLHLGLRRGATYLDPLSVLGPLPVRLKPLDGSRPAATQVWPGMRPSPVRPVNDGAWLGNSRRSGPRMGLLVGSPQAVGADVGVQLGGGQ